MTTLTCGAWSLLTTTRFVSVQNSFTLRRVTIAASQWLETVGISPRLIELDLEGTDRLIEPVVFIPQHIDEGR